MKSLTTLLVLWFLVVMSSCEKDDSDRQPDLSYNPVIRPENFTDHVNHPFFPLVS